jgi:hypothetical protein
VDTGNVMIGESAGKLRSKVPLSSNNISCRIKHIAEGLNDLFYLLKLYLPWSHPLRFPLPILIPPTTPYLLGIVSQTLYSPGCDFGLRDFDFFVRSLRPPLSLAAKNCVFISMISVLYRCSTHAASLNTLKHKHCTNFE